MTTRISVRFLHFSFISSLLLFGLSAVARAQSADEMLLDAALNGNGEEVERLLDEEGANPNAQREEDHWTPLMLAAMNGYTDITAILLNHDADPNLGNDDEGTALCVAAAAYIEPEEGPTAIFDLLLERGADINGMNGSSMNVLMYAAREGKIAIVERLLQAGADVNYTDAREWTALWLAASNDQVEVARVLLAAGADPDVHAEFSYWTPLIMAAENNSLEMTKILLEAGADASGKPPGTDYFTPPLSYAAKQNNLEYAKLLLEHGALPNYADGGYNSEDEKSRTPLDWAKENKNKEMETLLRKAGAVDDLPGTYKKMLEAVRKGDTKAFKKFMDMRVDPRLPVPDKVEGDEGEEEEIQVLMLSEAAARGNTEIVKSILAFPYPPNSYELYTAYGIAQENEQEEIVDMLIRFSPGDMAVQAVENWQNDLLERTLELDPNAANFAGFDGQTPLHMAAQSGDETLVSILLEADADVEKPDRWGETPLFSAVRAGSQEVVEQLLEAGADPNVHSKNGLTLLHAAVLASQNEMIGFLIEAAELGPYETDNRGWNPLHFAAWNGDPETIRVLFDLGMDPLILTSNGETALDIARRVENDTAAEVLEAVMNGE